MGGRRECWILALSRVGWARKLSSSTVTCRVTQAVSREQEPFPAPGALREEAGREWGVGVESSLASDPVFLLCVP